MKLKKREIRWIHQHMVEVFWEATQDKYPEFWEQIGDFLHPDKVINELTGRTGMHGDWVRTLASTPPAPADRDGVRLRARLVRGFYESDVLAARLAQDMVPGVPGDCVEWRWDMQPTADLAEHLLLRMPAGVPGDTVEWRQDRRDYLDAYYEDAADTCPY